MVTETVNASTALVGVDLGGTKIAAALVDPDGALLGPVSSCPTPAHDGPEAMLDAIAKLIIKVVQAGTDDAPGTAVNPVAIGIGAAGVIDPTTGSVISATDAITDWPGTQISAGVCQRLADAGISGGKQLHVHVDNDVNAYAAGEAWLGAGAGADSALVVAVGTGVGGAIVLGGRVYHGAHCLAGEMGHMPSHLAADETCTCGRLGHLEAVGAGPQIARRYREATGSTEVTTALVVERLAGAGDATAQRIYQEAAVALGQAIAAVITVLDPHKVIISGGLARSGELWWGPLRETVRAELVDLVAKDLELVPAVLGTNAPIIGASHEAWLTLPKQA
ncbi:Fructokinase [Actinomyces bovis]|uniref:Fructokinase n=1 Tax=Actinomyces bovis TaxID=1658 RepID=A0ABY1VPC4_9ACTO|nr:Fructokinase [Actinomyces bovis]VEG53224.1 Fructokinase [Actinomyces israelii]